MVHKHADPEFSAGTKKLGILVVLPTRELAVQCYSIACELAKSHDLGVNYLIGGEDYSKQNHSLATKRHDIIICTPGRLLYALEKNFLLRISLPFTKTLILDEFDFMLRPEFKSDILQIVGMLPKNRQNILVSATTSPQILKESSEIFGPGNNYLTVSSYEDEKPKTNISVKHSYIPISWSLHFPALFVIINRFLQNSSRVTANVQHGSKILIFLPTVAAAEVYGSFLSGLFSDYSTSDKTKNPEHGITDNKSDILNDSGLVSHSGSDGLDIGIPVCILHGKLNQQARDEVSSKFRDFDSSNNKSIIMVTTDVSARGMDYPDVNLVIQIGIPNDASQYLHRIGRTARAGKSGECITLTSSFESRFLAEASAYIGESNKIRLNSSYNSEFGITLSRALKHGYRNAELEVFNSRKNSASQSADISQNDLSKSKIIQDIDANPIKLNSLADNGKPTWSELAQYMTDFAYKFENAKTKVKISDIKSMYTSLLTHYSPLSNKYSYDPSKAQSDLESMMKRIGIYNVPENNTRFKN
ncbi:DEAD-box ATP-dependent RNA helicase 25 [Smittium culicis]|uniref:ATP-dependent RNA helicase n=1 Tax=Smittium culicis TaxID=133412 RepID=A0A1R1XP08_9FUNG|nr:DEAD-box ATP-dependent RNA helicase 25 [Smittium culicis]